MAYDWQDWKWCERALEGGRRWVVLETDQGWCWGSEDAGDLDSLTMMDSEYYPSRWACIKAAEAAITRHLTPDLEVVR